MITIKEPKFLLEKESICYGCEYYKHVDDAYDKYTIQKEEIDSNGGVCDYYKPCINGSGNKNNL